jgi:siderophore synthetase component
MSLKLLEPDTSTSDKYRNEAQQGLAEGNAINCLLNCYIREYALAKKQVEFDDHQADAPATFNLQVIDGYRRIRLIFPESSSALVIKSDQVSLLGRVRTINQPYLKQQGLAWHPIDALALAQFILQHLALVMGKKINLELLKQIQNSIHITGLFIKRISNQVEESAYSSLIKSEQSLLWGHALHPAPKSRDGISFDQLLACSPEVQAKFPLYWFKVAPQLLKQIYCSELPPLDLVNKINPTEALLYPCHPWEVSTILKQPLVHKAMQLGLMSEVGFLGSATYPTASVRTVFVPQTNSFMKFSIHVRLTNCVRKNAWYELQSAVLLTRLISECSTRALIHCPKFSVMPEPAATSLDLSPIAAAGQRDNIQEVIECFGILYRDGIAEYLQKKYQPQMAGALFAWDKNGDSLCVKKLQSLAAARGESYSSLAVQWFDAYLDALLPGIFHYFFNLGIAFEPHLQNTVVGFENGLPAHIWLRDLEGTKLMHSHWPADKLSELSEKAKDSVYYSREQGWNRIAYCTLINNISEAIFHLSAGQQALETQLWQALAAAIEQWQLNESEQPELQAMLDGAPIPSKNNLTTRILKQADSLSSYSALKNPLAQLLEKS